MARDTTLSFEEFSADAARVFDRVIRSAEPVVIERGADRVVMQPVAGAARRRRARRAKSAADVNAFLSSAGGWRDVDIASFLRENTLNRARS